MPAIPHGSCSEPALSPGHAQERTVRLALLAWHSRDLNCPLLHRTTSLDCQSFSSFTPLPRRKPPSPPMCVFPLLLQHLAPLIVPTWLYMFSRSFSTSRWAQKSNNSKLCSPHLATPQTTIAPLFPKFFKY